MSSYIGTFRRRALVVKLADELPIPMTQGVHERIERCTFEIPKCDIDSRQSRHNHRSASVEAQAPDQLPDVLDVAIQQVRQRNLSFTRSF